MNGPKNIFLVEDDTDDQFFFANAMMEIDGAVLQNIANNGQEALEMLTTCDRLPDIIFLDINMAIMNGIECLTEIMKSPCLRDIPVVVLSTSVEQVALVTQLGAKAFIQKPPNESILREKIEQVISLEFISNGREITPVLIPVY